MLMARCLSIIAFLFLLLGAASSVEACSCPSWAVKSEEQEVNDSAKQSDVLCVGKVIKLIESRSSNGHEIMVVKLEVARGWLGTKGPKMTIRTFASSAACGFPFHEGLTYIVYAQIFEKDLYASLCSRTAIIKGQYGSPDERYLGMPSYIRPTE